MQTTAKKTRFITGNSSKSGFVDLKNLISSKEAFQQIFLTGFAYAENSRNLFSTLTNNLITIAENAVIRRDLDTLEEACNLLINLPYTEVQQIGFYYQARAKYRRGKIREAQSEIEKVADNAPLLFRARSFNTLGAYYYNQGLLDDALKVNFESLRIASSESCQDIQTALMANLNTCFIISGLGNHQESLSKLESLWPLVRIVSKKNPFHFYHYHNALAVEFAEAGRFDEAQAAIEIALASPFASAYPQWSETREEIAQKRDSRWSNLPALPEPLLAAESNSVSNQDSQAAADSQIQAEAEPHTEQARAIKPQRTAFYFSISKYNFQIPSENIPAKAAAGNPGSAQSILERLGKSIRPRSPPRSL